MSKYNPIIGLEIHIHPKTKSKMFCPCPADYFGNPPNTHVCPVCLGLPGALPVPNEAAIRQCIKLSLALNCKINKETKFDRKHYFYPDLPKGYQISQYDQPIGYDGELELGIGSEAAKGNRKSDSNKNETKAETKKIGITRIHMEEDAGKSVHEKSKTYLDFNKSGMPLVELVTEPDFRSGDEVDVFAKRLRQIVRYLGVSDADMEKGQMRYEINISLQKKGEKKLPDYKVEVKNIGSISVLTKVIDFEIKRQTEILDKGKTPVQETRGVRDMSGKTHSQRTKEEAQDYRYFPEPDIPPLEFSEKYLKEISSEIPNLPQELEQEYKSKYKIHHEIAETIAAEKEYSDFLAQLIKLKSDRNIINAAAKVIAGELVVALNDQETTLTKLIPEPELLLEILKLKEQNKINSTTQTELIEMLIEQKFSKKSDIQKYLEENDKLQTSDSEDLKPVVEKVVAREKDAKERYAKNPKVVMYFVGQVMKETRGAADPKVVQGLIEEILAS